MIKIERTEVTGWTHAIRGMRNALNSWDKSDSYFYDNGKCYDIMGNIGPDYMSYGDKREIGTNDFELMLRLAKQGSVHAKYRRMIVVYADITAPLYWWKEFDTYKVGTVANSCSTMHKIHAKEFTLDDFSHEHLKDEPYNRDWLTSTIADEDVTSPHKVFAPPLDILRFTIEMLNGWRQNYLETKDKDAWWQMIQLLPSSYNQKRTVMLNYEVLSGMYRDRKNHKLDEWVAFCKWIEKLPYSEIITLKEDK